MSDIEIIAATITGAAGVIVAAIRWGVRRLAKPRDRATEALIRNAASNGVLAAKFDGLAKRVGDRIDQRRAARSRGRAARAASRRSACGASTPRRTVCPPSSSTSFAAMAATTPIGNRPRTGIERTMTMFDNSFLSVLAFAAVVIGGVGAILGGVSIVLHAVAPRTKTTVDDRLAAGVDAAHAKLDQVLAALRGIVPATAAPTTPTTPPSASLAPSSAAKAGTVATVTLLAAMIGGVSLAPACHTLGPAAAEGFIAAIDCDAEVQHWLADGAAASTTAIAVDLAPFDSDAKKCARAAILAGSTVALASSSSGSSAGSNSAVATQGLSARMSVALAPSSVGGDPVQVRAAVSAAARQAGWPLIRVAGGTAL